MSLGSSLEGFAARVQARMRTLQALREAFAAHDKALQARRRKFRKDTPEANIELLSQTRIRKMLTGLSQTYWGRTSGERNALRADYWRALRTAKILIDDVFVETLGAIRDRPAGPDRMKETTKAHEIYWKTLVAFVRASPYLFADPAERTKDLYLLPSTPAHLKLLTTRLDLSSLDSRAESPGVETTSEYLLDLAAVRADSAFGEAVTDSNLTALDDETLHLQGITFLLQQMYLVRLRSTGAPSYPGRAWYGVANAELAWMRQNVLGRLAALEREAIIESNDSRRSMALADLGDQLLDELARVYSVRRAATTELWAFRRRMTDDDRFAESRLLVGANDVSERLSSYIGRPDPDQDRDIEVILVDYLVDHAETLAGEEVKVIGQMAAQASRLDSLTNRKKRVKLRIDRESLAAGRADKVAVQVNGTLEIVKNVSTLVVDTIEPFAEEYGALVGLPMPTLFSGDLFLRDSWRTETVALRAEADAEMGADSVTAAVMGQEQLITALGYVPPVRKVLLERLEQDETLDLHDSALRGAVWSALFEHFHEYVPNSALQSVLNYLQRYLSHFTRHTLWNVRDSGRDYFRTTWPQSIAGRALHDCGVYAVLVAYDIYRAVAAHKAAKRIDFSFVTFLDHVALVGYVDGKSFFVNNDKIHSLRDIPGGAGLSKSELARFALQSWGPHGFNEVYDVLYGVAVVRVPHWTISTTLSEATFKKRLWANYKRFAKWWGLRPDAAIDHHKEMAEYNTKMVELGRLLEDEDEDEEELTADSKKMLELSAVAHDLFNRANLLASKARYYENGRVADEGSIAVLHPEDKPPPVYEVVRRLVKARAAGETLTADQDEVADRPATPADHSDALNIEANLI